MLFLLFSKSCELLGEVHFSEGAYVRASLSHVGEAVLAQELAMWQVAGIPFRETQTHQTGTETGERRIALPSDKAEWAFTCWASDQGYAALSLPERLLPQWEKLSHLALAPAERFAVLTALLTAPYAVLEAWEKGIEQGSSLL